MANLQSSREAVEIRRKRGLGDEYCPNRTSAIFLSTENGPVLDALIDASPQIGPA